MGRSTVFYSVSCKHYRAPRVRVRGTPAFRHEVLPASAHDAHSLPAPIPARGRADLGHHVTVSTFGRHARAASPHARAPRLTIDALGRKCPIPIIMLAEQIREVPIGEIIAVRADDPAAYTDIPSWCGLKSHELVYRDALDSGWEFGVRRQY